MSDDLLKWMVLHPRHSVKVSNYSVPIVFGAIEVTLTYNESDCPYAETTKIIFENDPLM